MSQSEGQYRIQEVSTFPRYHRIRLQAVRYTQAKRAADWEFTYDDNGQLTQVLNRNILANAHHAYAMYWSTPASEWKASYHYFRAFAATFRPAGGTNQNLDVAGPSATRHPRYLSAAAPSQPFPVASKYSALHGRPGATSLTVIHPAPGSRGRPACADRSMTA